MDSTEWLRQWSQSQLQTDLLEESMIPVRNFVFIWNVFEQTLYSRAACEKDIAKDPPFVVPGEIIDEIYNQIRDRYFDKEGRGLTDKFIGLFNDHKNKEYEEKVKQILVSKKEATETQKGFVCRMVLWRYRCNLFHGEKTAYYLLQDNSLFEFLNIYMIALIESSFGK